MIISSKPVKNDSHNQTKPDTIWLSHGERYALCKSVQDDLKMLPDGEQLDGNPWQEYVDSLLNAHYSLQGEVYQRVPAKGGGDAGLEGFSTSGHAYQSYSDQGSQTHRERTTKQKNKITRDLAKLKKNKKYWEETLQGVKLRKWSLIVPKLEDREVVTHARKKAAELIGENLPFIADDFQGCVETADAFPAARAALSEPALVSKILCPKLVTDKHVEDMESKEPDFVQNLDDKLAKAAPNHDVKDSRRDFLRWHLRCSNFLEDLRQKFPMHWETIDQLATTVSAAIQTQQRFDKIPPGERLVQVKADMEIRLKEAVSFLSESERIVLAFGHIARWMGECSLLRKGPNA